MQTAINNIPAVSSLFSIHGVDFFTVSSVKTKDDGCAFLNGDLIAAKEIAPSEWKEVVGKEPWVYLIESPYGISFGVIDQFISDGDGSLKFSGRKLDAGFLFPTGEFSLMQSFHKLYRVDSVTHSNSQKVKNDYKSYEMCLN